MKGTAEEFEQIADALREYPPQLKEWPPMVDEVARVYRLAGSTLTKRNVDDVKRAILRQADDLDEFATALREFTTTMQNVLPIIIELAEETARIRRTQSN